MCINDLYRVAICRFGHTAYSDVICFSKRICASTVEASEPVFRHISRVCGRASSVRIEVFRTASSVCKVVNKVSDQCLCYNNGYHGHSECKNGLLQIHTKHNYHPIVCH